MTRAFPNWTYLLGKISPQANGCWLWTGGCDADGYGMFGVDGKSIRVHRWLYEQRNGPVEPLDDGSPRPLDHFVCSTPSCVNWDHLRPVSHRENVLRGNSIQSANAAKTSCHRGHPFDERNTYIRKDGRRQCKACGREYLTRVRRERLGVSNTSTDRLVSDWTVTTN